MYKRSFSLISDLDSWLNLPLNSKVGGRFGFDINDLSYRVVFIKDNRQSWRYKFGRAGELKCKPKSKKAWAYKVYRFTQEELGNLKWTSLHRISHGSIHDGPDAMYRLSLYLGVDESVLTKASEELFAKMAMVALSKIGT